MSTRAPKTAAVQAVAHTCVFFDDGADGLLCACGGRALKLIENGEELLVTLLAEDDALTLAVRELAAARNDLAASA